MRGPEPPNEPLNERERLVLQALIDAHIATSEPVGSKAIAQLSDLGVSPATIRNVLAALDERGLIAQPHTSAGRVPTDKGLRYYVDSLLRLQQPSEAERGEIVERIEDAGMSNALREASRVLTRIAKHTTIVVAARPESARVKHVELLRLRDDAVLLILVFHDGKVQNRLLEWRGDLTDIAPNPADLERVGNRLTSLVGGRTLEEARQNLISEIRARRDELNALEQKLMHISAKEMAATEPTVLIEGTAHLLESQQDVQRTKELLELLEEEERVEKLLARAAAAPGIRIFIGEENPASALSERGMVAAPLGTGGALGVLGVIGPRHLDYGRVVPLVDLTAQVVSKALKG
jgi:heat-inducible transcriptional repressor